MLEDAKGNVIPKDPKTKENANSTMGRAVDVNPNGTHCAIGMKDGSLRIYTISNWQLAYMKKISKEWIEDLKFSPSGEYLAVSSHDNKIYLYTVADLRMIKKLGVSSSYITHLDWS